MSARRLCLVLVSLLLPAGAEAHRHKADAAFGGSDATGSALFGPYFSFAHSFKRNEKEKEQGLSWLLDISNHVVGSGDDGVTKFIYTGGIRWWTPLKSANWHTFAQVNATVVREMKENAATLTDVKPSITLGLDRDLTWGLTAAEKKAGKVTFAWRFQVDLFRRSSQTEARISTGVVYRWDYATH